jgi:hypothetical protein
MSSLHHERSSCRSHVRFQMYGGSLCISLLLNCTESLVLLLQLCVCQLHPASFN